MFKCFGKKTPDIWWEASFRQNLIGDICLVVFEKSRVYGQTTTMAA